MLRRIPAAATALVLAAGCMSAPETAPAALLPEPEAAPLLRVADVPARLETDIVGDSGDVADDPAVWVHPADRAQSLVFGTNKREGLFVFGLDGRIISRLPVGRLNNIDLRQDADRPADFAFGTNRSTLAISVFAVSRATAEVSWAGDVPVGRDEPYGICAGWEDGRDLAAVTYKDGLIQLWELDLSGAAPSGQLLHTVQLPSQLEGCVFDEEAGRMFIGEEDAGIWSLAYRDPEAEPTLIDTVDGPSGLVADVEGMSLWRGAGGSGWLVVSAQHADRFIVYDRQPPHAAMGAFTVRGNAAGVDDVTHTDGVHVRAAALPGFPRGLLVVHDDSNPNPGENQNFKLVHWGDVETALGLPLLEMIE